jgi:hypothetical protein
MELFENVDEPISPKNPWRNYLTAIATLKANPELFVPFGDADTTEKMIGYLGIGHMIGSSFMKMMASKWEKEQQEQRALNKQLQSQGKQLEQLKVAEETIRTKIAKFLGLR